MVRRLVVSSSDSYDKKEDKIQTKEDIYAKNSKKLSNRYCVKITNSFIYYEFF